MPDPGKITPERMGGVAMAGAVLGLAWRACWPLFVATLALTFVTGLLPLAAIVISSALLDILVRMVTAPHPMSDLPVQLVLLLVASGGITLAGILCSQLRMVTLDLFQKRVSDHVNLLIAEQATALDLAFFENPEFYNLLSNAKAEASYRPAQIVSGMATIISEIVTLISITVILVLWHLWIVPVMLLSSLVRLLITTRIGRKRATLILEQTPLARTAQYVSMLLTTDITAKEIRLFRLSGFLLTRYRALLHTIFRQNRNLAREQVIYSGVLGAILASIRPTLLAYVAIQTVQRLVTIGQFSLFSQAITQMDNGLSTLITTVAQLYENDIFMKNLFRFLELRPDVEAPRAKNTSAPLLFATTPTIEFRAVTFHYPDAARPTIDDLSFCIKPGEAVALVGTNGAGKTTLVKLLTGLYLPTAGKILFDGIDISTLDRAVLRAYISVIFQDYPVFHFSAFDNIGVGQIDAIEDHGRIEAAARQSGVDQILNDLPDKFHTVLGRFIVRGHELSGGQRQLLALARALMRSATILVLDEPTAALDTENEQRFFCSLLESQQPGARTVLFISHRFSTVRRADRILVLEQGKLIEQGTHDELICQAGRYSQMFNAQAQHYLAMPNGQGANRDVTSSELANGKVEVH